MIIFKFNIYTADLNPSSGTEPGKIRPVVIIQSDLLNQAKHPSTIVCPLSTQVFIKPQVLRIPIKKTKTSGLSTDSYILTDQIRSIDNRRFIKRIGKLTTQEQERLLDALRILILE